MKHFVITSMGDSLTRLGGVPHLARTWRFAKPTWSSRRLHKIRYQASSHASLLLLILINCLSCAQLLSLSFFLFSGSGNPNSLLLHLLSFSTPLVGLYYCLYSLSTVPCDIITTCQAHSCTPRNYSNPLQQYVFPKVRRSSCSPGCRRSSL